MNSVLTLCHSTVVLCHTNLNLVHKLSYHRAMISYLLAQTITVEGSSILTDCPTLMAFNSYYIQMSNYQYQKSTELHKYQYITKIFV